MVAVGDKWRFIDKEGTLVIDAHLHRYELLYNLAADSMFSEGLSAVKLENGSFAFIDRSGLIVIDITFDSAKPFSEGLAAVEVDGNWGYIDRHGKFVIEPRFETAESFTEGLASVGVWVDN